jgi:hypothetical protein
MVVEGFFSLHLKLSFLVLFFFMVFSRGYFFSLHLKPISIVTVFVWLLVGAVSSLYISNCPTIFYLFLANVGVQSS